MVLKLHPFSEKDRKEGRALFDAGKIKQIVFSEGTYQVEVLDPKTKTTYWPFLQCEDSGEVRDCFCTCKSAEKMGSCPHLAAALLKVFGRADTPLHVRFAKSLWNHLCLIASRRHGFAQNCLKKNKEGSFVASLSSGKGLFSMRALNDKGRKQLGAFIEHRKVETEETSLKFSNLPPEEILLWRQGRPGELLQYELSFWSDLAKWWMILQEDEKGYKITFSSAESGHLPKWITIRFSSVEASFYIAEVDWKEIIPTLKYVNSPLVVEEFYQQRIQKIVYESENKELLIDFVEQGDSTPYPPKQIGLPIGEWIYVENRGFYPAHSDPLLREKVIHAQKIAPFLTRHRSLVEKYLVGTVIHRGNFKANYHLFLDMQQQLHIVCYLIAPGDLQDKSAAYFGPWIYLPEKGFYLLDNLLFDGIEKVIPKFQVSDFVNHHRVWLHSYEGFQTHISSLEPYLVFTLTAEGLLRFDTKVDLNEEGEEIHDFGEWVHIKGRGFYAKMTQRPGGGIKPGSAIAPQDISRFIRNHREELETIKGFFASRSPLKKVGLTVYLNKNGRIVVSPEYFYNSSYSHETVKRFGDFLYVEGEGFSEIDDAWKLPEEFMQEKEIDLLAEPYFVAFELDALAPWIVSIDPCLVKPQQLKLRIHRIKQDKKAKTGGWLFDLSYESEIGNIDLFALWNGIAHNKRYLFTGAGLILLKPARFNWLKGISKKRFLKGGKRLRLTLLEWMRLSLFEETEEPDKTARYAEETQQYLDEFKQFRSPAPVNLAGFTSQLRSYQEAGVRWLWFLYSHQLSGLLCDEMGLGKTHQAMGLLAAVANEKEGGKYLVVCPTSVIYHWQGLLERYLPKLRVLVYYGARRTLDSFEANYDLLLTSYGTLRSEKKTLAQHLFTVAIFDEIQIAKNPASQTHKALRKIDTHMRIGLTGTPIENRLLELKALFDLILPAYLPNESFFREFFIHPIEKNEDPDKKSLLSRLIKPFILRRKKSEVLLELPEKTEEIAYTDLSEEQKMLYQNAYAARKDALLKEIAEGERPLPLTHIFSLLTTLKQICDHPCLITGNIEEYHKHYSGKWDLFVELLQEARESGQKVVVFSQYLKMLDIIELYLKEKKIGYAGIRGSTRDRKSELDRFREDPTCEVFVGSLQAAGVGIDLIAASVVIHYDRWWNPAKENQATDRVHRIGQSRGVQVFKMVSKGTIEEHIHRLIQKKMGLLEGVIGFDEQDQIKGLDRQELITILKLIEHDASNEKHPI